METYNKNNFIIYFFIGALLTIALNSPIIQGAGDVLDPSWSETLGYALVNKLEWGRDIIYSYGPLGYFLHDNQSYYHELYYQTYIVKLIISILFSFLFIFYSLKIDIFSRSVFLISLFLFISTNINSIYYLILTLCGYYIINNALDNTLEKYQKYFLTLALCFLIAFISLGKFTNFTLAFVILFIISIYLSFIKHYQHLIVFFISISLSYFFWLLISHQTLFSFIDYIKYSSEIAKEYSVIMSEEGLKIDGYLSFALLSIYIILFSRCFWYHRKNLAYIFILSILLCSSFITYKAGFSTGGVNYTTLLYFLSLAVFIEPMYSCNNHRFLVLFAALCLGIGSWIHSTSIKNNFFLFAYSRLKINLQFIKKPNKLKSQLTQFNSYLESMYDLKESKKIIQNSTVDVLSNGQGIAYRNKLNYTLRPAFQSFVTFTNKLMDINLKYYQSNKKPKYILYKLDCLETFYPFACDTYSIRNMLLNYRYILSEKDYLLFEDSGKNESIYQYKKLFEKQISFNETLKLDDYNTNLLFIEASITTNYLGKALKLLFRLNPPYIKIYTNKGQYQYKAPADMMASGFLINPVITSQKDLISILNKELKPETIQKIEFFFKDNFYLNFFNQSINIKLYKDERIAKELNFDL